MTGKTSKQHFFDVQLNWLYGTKGILSVKDINLSALVDAPSDFGGEGKTWTPEHLFLSAVTSCFMSTFLVFVKKIRFNLSGFECVSTGQVEVIDGKYKFTYIHLYPKAFVTNELEKEKAQVAMEKAKKYCLVSNSVDAEIIYHMEVQVDEPEEKDTLKKTNGQQRVSSIEAKKIGQKIGIDFNRFDLEQFRRGLEVEMEHGTEINESNITNDDVYMTGKIAWAHLHEIPDYYSRLDKMEKEAEYS